MDLQHTSQALYQLSYRDNITQVFVQFLVYLTSEQTLLRHKQLDKKDWQSRYQSLFLNEVGRISIKPSNSVEMPFDLRLK